MYALVHNNQIKVGPRQYHKGFFNDYLEQVGVSFELPLSYSAQDTITVSPEIKIVKVAEPTYPEYDQRTEQLAGPYYNVSVEPITGEFQVADKPLDAVKNEMKAEVAEVRYGKECGGTTVTLQGTEVSVETARDERHIWFQSFVLLPEGAVQRFKFPKEQVWLDLSKAEIGSVVQSIVLHVQSAFDWESAKVAEIDAATTKEELEAVVIVEEPAA